MCSANKCFFGTLISLMCLLQFTRAAFLRCYNGSLDNYIVTPLDVPMDLSPCINTGLPTVVYTFGYRGKITGPATTAVITAYIAKKKRNVILLDWEEEAQSGLLGMQLGYALNALPNAKRIGKQLGGVLMEFSKIGVHMTDIHLVGHSLGAQVMAYAGRQARENGYVVGRITGLDPARALFEGPITVASGLDRTSARFVDIIHTDPGGFGSNTSTGTVDIWPNYTGTSGSQPGCPAGNFETFSPEDLCSHDRSWQLFVEAIRSPTSLSAAAAANYDAWIANDGQTNQTIYLGDLTSIRAEGNFYLQTKSEPPFSMGIEGTKPPVNQAPASNQARTRRNPLLTTLLRYLY